MSFLIYITWSLGLHYVFAPEFDIKFWVQERFNINARWTASYIIGLALFYYMANRGNPRRDCPSCGAYAGGLKLQKNEKEFVRYRHQTKRGTPDKRYKLNPKLFKMTTFWRCSYCESDLKYIHELSATPNKVTTQVISKFVL